jgi:hypothetical protein
MLLNHIDDSDEPPHRVFRKMRKCLPVATSFFSQLFLCTVEHGEIKTILRSSIIVLGRPSPNQNNAAVK